jgi:hypothetical protein
MGAPDLETLLQFEKNFEDAAVTFLESGVGISCYASASDTNFETPRLEVQFTTQGAQEPVDKPITSTPSLAEGEYRKYEADLVVQVITDASAGQTRANHFLYVGKVRKELLRSSDNWGAVNLPYYALKDLRPTGTERGVEGDFQLTALRYLAKFAIKADAFPS